MSNSYFFLTFVFLQPFSQRQNGKTQPRKKRHAFAVVCCCVHPAHTNSTDIISAFKGVIMLGSLWDISFTVYDLFRIAVAIVVIWYAKPYLNAYLTPKPAPRPVCVHHLLCACTKSHKHNCPTKLTFFSCRQSLLGHLHLTRAQERYTILLVLHFLISNLSGNGMY